MNCIDVIEDMKQDFVAQTGKKPTDIYIGKREMETLPNFIFCSGAKNPIPISETGRRFVVFEI